MNGVDVSVVMAVKNEQRYLESALRSVCGQSGVALEVVLVDDGSTDDTRAIASRLLPELPMLQLHQNPGQGKCAAFNFGVRNSSGRFVCLFAGDDIMPEGSLAARWLAVKDCTDESPVIGLCRLRTISEDKRYDGHIVPRKPDRGALSGVSYLMNAPAVQKLFPIPETLPNEDTWLELAVTLFPGLNLVHSGVIGCDWRVHEGNSINSLVTFDEFNARYSARMAARSLFYDRHGSELSPENRTKLLGLIDCEKARLAGRPMKILFTRAALIDKLRAISYSGASLYWVRNQLYGLLSGW